MGQKLAIRRLRRSRAIALAMRLGEVSANTQPGFNTSARPDNSQQPSANTTIKRAGRKDYPIVPTLPALRDPVGFHHVARYPATPADFVAVFVRPGPDIGQLLL